MILSYKEFLNNENKCSHERNQMKMKSERSYVYLNGQSSIFKYISKIVNPLNENLKLKMKSVVHLW